MKQYFSVFITLFLLIAIVGCDSSSTDQEGMPADNSEVTIPPDQNEQLGLSNQESNLVLKKAMLGQEMVLLPTLKEISAPTTATDVFATKLVYFEQKVNNLYLMEVMEGRTITDPYEPVSILAQFPIVADTQDELIFDFKTGFDALIINYGDFVDADLPDSTIPIHASYLENFDAKPKNFSFDHIAQVSVANFFGTFLRTVRFTYTFVPSHRDLISELLPDEEERFGYFLTRPTYERATGEPHQVVHRWDTTKILFHISSNTPAEFVDYVRQGVLAWNETFGEEVIKVKDAPEGVISGTPGYNVVQWVGFDEAPGAYTIWHAHPRSGQILDANVIFTSVFAVKSQAVARRILEVLAEKSEDSETENTLAIGLAGFETNRLCDNRFSKSAIAFLKLAASGEFSDDQILKMSQLFVKSIVMHEIGHALGLRHNFHGNLGSQISAENDEQNLREVIAGNIEQGSLPSASIMDYLDFQDSIRMYKPGKYDAMAISWAYGYGDQNFANPNPYCTDQDIYDNADCKPFDGGAEPIFWYQQKLKDYSVYLSKWLGDTILDQIERDEEDEPVLDEYINRLAYLTDYLDESQTVLDLPGASIEDRRARAATATAALLKASDENFNAVLNLTSAKLQARLQSLSSADENKQEVLAQFQNLRDATLSFLFDKLNMLTRPFRPFRPGQTDDYLEIAESGSGLNQIEQIVGPLAQALAGIAVNHVAIDVPSEPMEFRLGAASLINNFKPALVAEIKAQAIAKVEANIAALENARLTLPDPAEQQRYQQLIYDEEEILFALGGRPRFDLPAEPLEDEEQANDQNQRNNNYAQVS
ncbi:MAG: zinc-dependent metalloprotease [Pseudomonadota bacterium]